MEASVEDKFSTRVLPWPTLEIATRRLLANPLPETRNASWRGSRSPSFTLAFADPAASRPDQPDIAQQAAY